MTARFHVHSAAKPAAPDRVPLSGDGASAVDPGGDVAQSGDTEADERLATIESYYDAAPRSCARVEELPPFRLVVNEGAGWPFYARPRPDAASFAPADVTAVRRRQRELSVPEAFEWVAELAPDLRRAAQEAGMAVSEHPLMLYEALGDGPAGIPPDVDIRIVRPDDGLQLIGAVAPLGFSAPGTDIGEADIEDLRRLAAQRTPETIAFERERIATGRTVMAVALTHGLPVGVGSHQPLGGVSEVAGVATLPAYRRRGIAAAVTALLVRDALERGVTTIYLSAGEAAVARIYAGIGFRTIATACIAEPATRQGPATES